MVGQVGNQSKFATTRMYRALLQLVPDPQTPVVLKLWTLVSCVDGVI